MSVTFTPRQMMERLVAFDTTSHLSNLPLIDFVRDYLDGWGVPYVVVPDVEGAKASLYATIGPRDSGGVVLSGHSDVVPVEGQDWASDPFTVSERDGRLYGRGTADMKGFVAIALALVPEFLDRPLATPVHLAISYDEEVGCLGVRPLVERIVADFPRPRLVIVGEPTRMQVVNAHKSAYAFVTEVTGVEAHSSATHLGVNAIMVAGELIGELNRIAEEMRGRGDPSGRFTPPYTTVHVGLIEGGTALNIIPRRCRFEWEFRGLPGHDPDEIPARLEAFADPLRAAVREQHREADIVTRCVNHVPAFVPEDGSPAESLALALARQNETHAVSYMTEASLFQAAEIPTVICGPGDIAQAHKPNEFIALDQVEKCVGFMRRLIDELRAD